MTKGEIAHDEEFFLQPQCFHLCLTIKLSFMEIFQVFVTMFSKSQIWCMWERVNLFSTNRKYAADRLQTSINKILTLEKVKVYNCLKSSDLKKT